MRAVRQVNAAARRRLVTFWMRRAREEIVLRPAFAARSLRRS